MRSEEYPHVRCFHWIWNRNSMVVVLWWWLPKVELDDYCEPGQLVIACKKKLCMYLSPFFFTWPPTSPNPNAYTHRHVHSNTVEKYKCLAICLTKYIMFVLWFHPTWRHIQRSTSTWGNHGFLMFQVLNLFILDFCFFCNAHRILKFLKQKVAMHIEFCHILIDCQFRFVSKLLAFFYGTSTTL